MDMELLHIYLHRYINENSSTKYARTVYLFFCAVIYFQINAVRLRSHTASWKKRSSRSLERVLTCDEKTDGWMIAELSGFLIARVPMSSG